MACPILSQATRRAGIYARFTPARPGASRPAGRPGSSFAGMATMKERILMKRGLIHRSTALAALLLIATAGPAQRRRFQPHDDDEAPLPAREAEFHFLRVEYTDLPQYHRRWGYASRDGMGTGWGLVDWPDADNHFTTGIQRLTGI